MAFDRPRCKPRDLCIICGEEQGTFRTTDGMVCTTCMPADLIPRAETLRKHEIVIHRKMNPDHSTIHCAPASGTGRVSGDRSMAITLSDDVILADELNAKISSAEGDRERNRRGRGTVRVPER